MKQDITSIIAALEQAAAKQHNADGMTVYEMREATGWGAKRISEHLRRGLANGTITQGMRTSKTIHGRSYNVPVYAAK